MSTLVKTAVTNIIGAQASIQLTLNIYKDLNAQGIPCMSHTISVVWASIDDPYGWRITLISYDPKINLWSQKLKKTSIHGSTSRIPLYARYLSSRPHGFLTVTRNSIILKTNAKDSLEGKLRINSKDVKKLLSTLQEWSIYTSVLL